MSNVDAYSTGYVIGLFLFLGILGLIFWFAGRWGWIGVLVRIVCAGLMVLRVLPLVLAFAPSS